MKLKEKGTLRQNINAYILLLPVIVVYAYFVIIPAAQTVYISLTRWDGIGPKRFIGLQNYINLFSDERFWYSGTNNIIWAIGSATIPIFMGVVLANFIVRGKIKFARTFQLIYFLPQAISTVVAAVIWKWIYNPVLGPLNTIFTAIGLERFAFGWLGNPNTVLIALFVIHAWKAFGFTTVLFSAAIRSLNENLFEAAIIDGCNSWGQFWYITIPGIKQAITSTLLLMIIWSFQVFDIIVTTTGGGPGYHSYVISYFIYDRAFITSRMGYGASAAIILTLVILVFARAFMYYREKE